jgi:hypothetical protein
VEDSSGISRKAALAPMLLISNITIKNGSLWIFRPASTLGDIMLSDINCTANNISLLAPFDTELSFVFSIGNKRIRCNAYATINAVSHTLTLNRMTAETGIYKLNISGTISNIHRPGECVFDIQLKGDKPVLDMITSMIPSAASLSVFPFAKVNFHLSGTPSRLKIAFAKK